MVTVTNADELSLALQNAQAGDTIVLSGGDYGDVSIANLALADYVTIVSADSSDPAVFSSLTVSDSSFLRFDGIKVEYILEPDEPDWVSAMRVDRCDHIEIINSEFTGSVDGDYANDGQGLLVLDSIDIVVENNTFHDLKAGVGFGRSEYIELRGNSFYDLRSEGANFGSVSHVVVEDNSFTNFHPVSGDHPDMIQFYNESDYGDMTDVVIRNNSLTQGTGAPVQGIFIEGVSSNGSHPYGANDFLIEANTIELGSAQGIWVYNVEGLEIRDNAITQADGGPLLPSIYTFETTGAVVSGNTVPSIADDGSDGITYSDNVITKGATIIDGTDGADLLVGDGGGDVINGGAGNDRIEAGDGNDDVSGGDGNDTIFGQAGDDTLRGDGGNDAINGGAGADKIYCGDGNDGVYGGGGNDTILGEAGDDTIYGDGGNDAINGGSGADKIYGGAGNDGVFGGGGNDTILGEAGDDTLFGDGGNDLLNGGAGSDKLHGGGGNDGILGGGGDDWIWGDAGADMMFGDGGNDVLMGGTGDDILIGGSGADVFVFGSADGQDTISDFSDIDFLQFSLDDFSSSEEVLGAAEQDGADTVITIGAGHEVRLVDVAITDLSDSQFLLV
jgi:Ca2+-binding RTX toxin-like protein